MCFLRTVSLLLAAISFGSVVRVAHAQGETPTHPVDGKYIKEWLILGPLFTGDPEKDFLFDAGGEAEINLKEGGTLTTTDGRTLSWKRYTARGYVMMKRTFVISWPL